MKKNILLLLLMMLLAIPAFADEKEDALAFFNNYVESANNYSSAIADMYSPSAKIIRQIVKPDGTKVALDKLSEAGNAEVTRIINGVKNREQATLASLQNVIGRETNNGVTRKFVTQATDATLDGVRSARTNKSNGIWYIQLG
jgi:hypothetical protein